MKKILILVLVSTCAVAGWRVMRGGGGDSAPAAHDDKLVLDRVWIDHMPKNDRDRLSGLAVMRPYQGATAVAPTVTPLSKAHTDHNHSAQLAR